MLVKRVLGEFLEGVIELRVLVGYKFFENDRKFNINMFK